MAFTAASLTTPGNFAKAESLLKFSGSMLKNVVATKKIERTATSSVSAYLLRNKLITEEIAGGHAFIKHVIQRKEIPGFSQKKFRQHIQAILNNPSDMKLLTRGRTGYWDQTSGTVIVRDPARLDGGTAFRPLQGKKYYDNVLK